jgi:diphthamide synthase (EF-2-diphthine--ammonia ligase)
MAFGDLHLADIRAYREGLLDGTGIQPVFPLWGKDTRTLGRDMIGAGLDARVICVDPSRLPVEAAGRRYDLDFLADLPDGVDACGENGEFHTFVCEGPLFAYPIQVRVGDRVTRDGSVFCDLTLAEPD